MAYGWVKVLQRDEELSENPYNNGGTDLVKLIESWGYFSENYIMAWKYPTDSFKDQTAKDYNETLEKRQLDKTGKSKPFFYYGGFYDLIDYNNEPDVDFCQGYTYRELYKALTSSSNVDNLRRFASALANTTKRHSDIQNVTKTIEENHNR